MPATVVLWLACTLAGLGNAVSFAWPWMSILDFGQTSWVLQCLSMVLYGWLLFQARNAKTAATIGFSFHALSLLISLSWLQVSMSQYGGMPVLIAWIAVALLATLLALYGALAAWTWKCLVERTPQLAVPLFGATWLLSELARGQWMTGFGWASAAYAHVDGPFAWTAPWLGSYGLGALVALCAAAVASWPRGVGSHRQLLVVGAVLVGWLMSPWVNFSEETGSLRAELLQGNIAQDEKFEMNTGIRTALRWYRERLQDARADVVLAPETAIPILPQQLPADYWQSWPKTGAQREAVRIVGIPLGDASTGYTNSVIGFQTPEAQPWYRYDKHHLVPFGEFIPPMFKWFVRLMRIPLGDFERGDLGQPPVVVRGERIAPAICFEDLFSEELAVRFRDPELSPTILANFSNLAWFGSSTAMYQHLNISRMRSIEFARPSLRVSNTGVTAVVDHDGSVRATLKPLTQGVLQVQIQGRKGITPYAWWASRWGQWPLWGVSLAMLGFGLARSRRDGRTLDQTLHR